MTPAHPYDAARAAIAASGMRQRDVAQHLGIDASKLSKSLSGVRRFTATELALLADLTGVPVRELAVRGEQHAPRQHDSRRDQARRDQARSSRRHAIVSAAWPLFAAHGYQPVTVADIAAAAGMSASAVHYYFPTKNEIFLATLDACSLQGIARRASAHAVADPVDRLNALFAVQLDGSPEAHREWATWAQFWSSSAIFTDAHDATEIAYSRWQRELLPVVQEGIDNGTFRAGDPQTMVTALTALIDGLGIRMLAGHLNPADVHAVVTGSIRGWITHSDSGGAVREPAGSPPDVAPARDSQAHESKV